MKRHKAQFLVLREAGDDEVTFAKVTAEVTDEKLLYESTFLSRLQDAVIDWVRDTKNGKLSYDNSAGDYNVGDLSTDLGDVELTASLEARGIFKLEIQIVSENDYAHDWAYDTHLVDDDLLGPA